MTAWAHVEGVNQLLAAGADVNARMRGGVTALLLAAGEGCVRTPVCFVLFCVCVYVLRFLHVCVFRVQATFGGVTALFLAAGTATAHLRTASCRGIFYRILTTFPLPYPRNPPMTLRMAYCRFLDLAAYGLFRNPFEFRCVEQYTSSNSTNKFLVFSIFRHTQLT